jgi:aminopeptidase YwaD
MVNMCQTSMAQDIKYAQQIIDTLTSSYFHGRGYVSDGDHKAAKFIQAELKSIGVKSVKQHKFSLNVNTFPNKMTVSTEHGFLTPGRDYLIHPSSPDIRLKSMKIVRVDEDNLKDDALYERLISTNFRKRVVLLDTVSNDDSLRKRRQRFVDAFSGTCLVEIKRDLTWSVSRVQSKHPHIWVLPGLLDEAQTLSAKVDATFIENYRTVNILGIIPGTERPDSFIVLTGHYDHLGRMGKETYMPGANDNASGIAMILDMARELQIHPPKYSVVLIAFAAEEAGLVGSFFFVHDLDQYMEKSRIRFLINMDLMGSGEEGIMAVNGKVFTEEYELLEKINATNKYLSQVKSRGKAANSDHYFFTEEGVPGFFFYLMGKYSYYHDIDDTSENLRLSPESYNNSFLLINKFMTELMSKGRE